MKLIEFHAIWCPSCLVMGNTFQKLKETFSEIPFASYDFDIDEEKAKQYHIDTKLPVFIIEKDGVELRRIVGEHSFKELKRIVEEYLV